MKRELIITVRRICAGCAHLESIRQRIGRRIDNVDEMKSGLVATDAKQVFAQRQKTRNSNDSTRCTCKCTAESIAVRVGPLSKN